MTYQSIIPGTPNVLVLGDASFKAQADTAISVVLREITHCPDLHEVSVCINAITAIREMQYRQEGSQHAPAPPPGWMPWTPTPPPGPVGVISCQPSAYYGGSVQDLPTRPDISRPVGGVSSTTEQLRDQLREQLAKLRNAKAEQQAKEGIYG